VNPRALTATALLLFSALSAGAEPRTVTLLFTNDFESAYDPTEAFWRDDMERIGGIAQLAALIEQERDAADLSFLFDAGDIFTGSLAHCSHGAISFDLFQLMGFEAMVIGNHEFEYGWESLAEEKSRAPFPGLGANLFYRDTDPPYAQPWTIIERDGVRVGVIGLLGQDAATALVPSNIAGVEVRPLAATLAPLAARLRPEVDVLVLIVHQGPTAPCRQTMKPTRMSTAATSKTWHWPAPCRGSTSSSPATPTQARHRHWCIRTLARA